MALEPMPWVSELSPTSTLSMAPSRADSLSPIQEKKLPTASFAELNAPTMLSLIPPKTVLIPSHSSPALALTLSQFL